jgi:glycosyltransferase involved in cell wall biosynthesis
MEIAIPKLKILFFTKTLGEGGVTRVILNVLKYLDREQFDPSLVLLHCKGERMNEVAHDINIYDLNVRGGKKGVDFLKLLSAFKRVLYDLHPQIVISCLWKPNIINLTARFSTLSLKHKVIVREDNALVAYFKDAHGPWVKGRVSQFMTKLLYPRADHVIAISEGLKKESIALGIPEQNITVINNPIDLESIDRLKLESVEINKPYILFAGRLCRQKNLPLLIDAFKLVEDKWDMNLLVLGKGEEERNLRALAKKLKIENRVIFKGFIANPYKYMHGAKVLVLSSDYEGFGNVLLEAMACGIPVVSTNCPHGPNEIIKDGINGYLVPMGDAEKLAEAIGKILENNVLRENFVTQGYEKIRSHEITDIVKQYEKLFIEVYSKSRTQNKATHINPE